MIILVAISNIINESNPIFWNFQSFITYTSYWHHLVIMLIISNLYSIYFLNFNSFFFQTNIWFRKNLHFHPIWKILNFYFIRVNFWLFLKVFKQNDSCKRITKFVFRGLCSFLSTKVSKECEYHFGWFTIFLWKSL